MVHTVGFFGIIYDNKVIIIKFVGLCAKMA